MKLPKTTNRLCPTCRKHTKHNITQAKKRTRGTARPLSRDSKFRTRKRGASIGNGNHGKYSKPALSKWKATGKKQTKKTDLRYECTVCKKMHVQKKGKRVKKVEFKQ